MSAPMGERSQNVVQAVQHRVIREAHDLCTGAPQVSFASLVVRAPLVMHRAVDFDDEA